MCLLAGRREAMILRDGSLYMITRRAFAVLVGGKPLCCVFAHLRPTCVCVQCAPKTHLSFFFDSVLIPDSLQRVFLAKNWFVGVKRCGEGVQRGVGGVLDHPRQQTEREAVN